MRKQGRFPKDFFFKISGIGGISGVFADFRPPGCGTAPCRGFLSAEGFVGIFLKIKWKMRKIGHFSHIPPPAGGNFKEQPDMYAAHPLLFSAGKFIAFERGELARRLEIVWQISIQESSGYGVIARGMVA